MYLLEYVRMHIDRFLFVYHYHQKYNSYYNDQLDMEVLMAEDIFDLIYSNYKKQYSRC
jgi:hypothetical protein